MAGAEDKVDAMFEQACAVAGLVPPPERRDALREQWQEMEKFLEILRQNEVPAAVIDGFTGAKK